MGFIDFMKDIFVGNRIITVKGQMVELSDKIYLQKMAIDKVLNFVSRTFSTAKFKTGDKEWDYLLNVQPNKNQSASEFWREAIYKLIYDNELLIVFTKDQQMKIADNFFIDDTYEFYDYKFKDVIVGNVQYDRSFLMNEVIYLKYNNRELAEVTQGLHDDYARLFSLMMDTVGRKGQIRGTLEIGRTGTFNTPKEEEEFLNGYIERLFNSFKNKSISIVPQANGMKYNEFGNGTTNNYHNFEDLTKLEDALASNVAHLIGVPPALIFGEKLELEDNMRLYKQFCVKPLMELISDELNAKIIKKKDYQSGRQVRISNVLTPDILDSADNIYKLFGSGFAHNEIRELFGMEKSDDPLLDEHFITKNFIGLDSLKGGDHVDEN